LYEILVLKNSKLNEMTICARHFRLLFFALSLVAWLKTRRWPHLLLSAGACIYRSISAASARAEQKTNRTPLLLSIDGTDGRTDT